MSSSHPPASPTSRPTKALVQALAVSWLLFFALGTWGHLALSNGLAESLYKSLQLFHLHYHPAPGPGYVEDIPLALQVARFGAGLWALALFPALVAFLFERKVFGWVVRRYWTDHTVVWGHCTRTLNLVQDLHRAGRRVVYIGACPVPQEQLPRGVLYLPGSAAHTDLLAHVAAQRARRLVALNESDVANLEILVAAEKLCAGARKADLPPLECSAHFADTHMAGGLYRTVIAAKVQPGARTRQHLFNYYDIMAGLLARQIPMPAMQTDAAPPPMHYVIVGFGAFGQCVTRKLVKMGLQLYRDGERWAVRKTRITVVDPLGDKATAPFLLSNPRFNEYCDFQVLPIGCDEASFLNLGFLVGGTPATRTSIVLCLETEALTVRTLLLLRDSCRQTGMQVHEICARLADPARLGPLLEPMQAAGAAPRLRLFAPDSEVFTADVLLARNVDVLARQVHEAYLKVADADARADNKPPAAGTPWENLSEDDREGNREAADHMWAKLAALGYELRHVPEGERMPPPDSELLNQLAAQEEAMARAEHERWMAWRLLNGWQWGTPRDNETLLHPDLVDYDQLAESTKEKDRIIIRAIPELLRQGRLRVTKGTPH